MSPRGKKNTSTAATEGSTADGTTANATPRKPKKAPKLVLEAKLGVIKDALAKLLDPSYNSVGAGEFTKAITGASGTLEAAVLLARGLADDWKPLRTRKSKNGLVQGDFAKTREKYLDIYKEKGLGAGPFKVLGVFRDKSVKIMTKEGAQYVPLKEIEKVSTPREDIAAGSTEPTTEPAANG